MIKVAVGQMTSTSNKIENFEVRVRSRWKRFSGYSWRSVLPFSNKCLFRFCEKKSRIPSFSFTQILASSFSDGARDGHEVLPFFPSSPRGSGCSLVGYTASAGTHVLYFILSRRSSTSR